MKYVCTVCGYIYDEAEDMPDDYVCPLCGASKEEFRPLVEDAKLSATRQGGSNEKKQELPSETKRVDLLGESINLQDEDILELSPLMMSALCSNLARGCQKQYMDQEAALWMTLSSYYKKVAPTSQEADYEALLAQINKDLEEGYPETNARVVAEQDRGALRALVWGEKVTRILRSLLLRYQKEGDEMLTGGVYVCTICGFVYIGDMLPDVCPVCKVPNWKFEKVEGR